MMKKIGIAILFTLAPTCASAQFVGPAASSISAAVNSGQVFFGGTTSTNIGIGASMRILVTNPVGSGVNCYVFEIDGAANPTSYARIMVNPTTSLPTTARPAFNSFFGNANTAKCSIAADVGAAMSGGTNTGVDIAMPLGVVTPPAGIPPYLVPPGYSLGLNIPETVAAIINVNLNWRESAP